jgi:hypothetical protein
MCSCGQVSDKFSCGRSTDCEFRVDAGFECDKAFTAAAVLERKTKRYTTYLVQSRGLHTSRPLLRILQHADELCSLKG